MLTAPTMCEVLNASAVLVSIMAVTLSMLNLDDPHALKEPAKTTVSSAASETCSFFISTLSSSFFQE
jgi:hypothetical protein